VNDDDDDDDDDDEEETTTMMKGDWLDHSDAVLLLFGDRDGDG